MSKKILILHTSIGLGHKYIAQNIGYQLEQAGCEVKVEDILEVQKGRLVEVSTQIHKWMNLKAPWIWSFLYFFTNLNFVSKITLPVRLWVASRNCQRTLEVINGFKPDVVISVHTTASGVIAYLKKKKLFTGIFGIGFSDFHLHKFWLYPNADFYLANIEEQKQEMLKLGIDEKKINVCGIALKPRAEFNIQEIKNRLGIKPGEKVVLIGSGSLGTGFKEKLIEDLDKEFQVRPIVVCGKNSLLAEKLKLKFKEGKTIVLGFYTPMQELYAIADIFLSKPGGLSTSESLQFGVPLFLTHYLPGQEELNVRYLQKKNLVMYEQEDLIEKIRTEMLSNEFKKSLKNNPNLEPILAPRQTVVGAVFQALN